MWGYFCSFLFITSVGREKEWDQTVEIESRSLGQRSSKYSVAAVIVGYDDDGFFFPAGHILFIIIFSWQILSLFLSLSLNDLLEHKNSCFVLCAFISTGLCACFDVYFTLLKGSGYPGSHGMPAMPSGGYPAQASVLESHETWNHHRQDVPVWSPNMEVSVTHQFSGLMLYDVLYSGSALLILTLSAKKS